MLLFRVAILSAGLGLGPLADAATDTRGGFSTVASCPSLLVHSLPRRSSEPVKVIATSVTRTGFLSVAADKYSLHSLRDRSTALGALTISHVELRQVLNLEGVQFPIARLAVHNEAPSLRDESGVVALVDDSKVARVYRTSAGAFGTQPLISIEAVVDIGFASGKSEGEPPTLVAFRQNSIEQYTVGAANSEGLSGKHLLKRDLRALIGESPTIHAVVLSADDYLIYQKDGTLSRIRAAPQKQVTPLHKFDKPIASISGFIGKGGGLAYWALDKNSDLWRGRGRTNERPTKVALNLPESVSPRQVIAKGSFLNLESNNFEEWIGGFLSRISNSNSSRVFVERVWILGSDGVVYSPWNAGTPNQGERLEFAGFLPTLVPSFASVDASSEWERLKFQILSNSPGLPIDIEQVRTKVIPFIATGEITTAEHLAQLGIDQEFIRLALQTPGTGLSEILDELGVPKDLVSRQIYVLCLSHDLAEFILRDGTWRMKGEELRRVNAALLESGNDFSRGFYTLSDSVRAPLLATLFPKLGLSKEEGMNKFMGHIAAGENPERTIYSILKDILESQAPGSPWSGLRDSQ